MASNHSKYNSLMTTTRPKISALVAYPIECFFKKHFWRSQWIAELPVEGSNGDDVTGLEAQLEQALGQTHDAVHELFAGLSPASGHSDHGISPDGGKETEAVANVGLWVISHFDGVNCEFLRVEFGVALGSVWVERSQKNRVSLADKISSYLINIISWGKLSYNCDQEKTRHLIIYVRAQTKFKRLLRLSLDFGALMLTFCTTIESNIGLSNDKQEKKHMEAESRWVSIFVLCNDSYF